MGQHPGVIEDRLSDFLCAVRHALDYAIMPDPDTRVAVREILRKLPARTTVGQTPEPGRNAACATFESALLAAENGPALTANVAKALRVLEPHLKWIQNPNYNARNQGALFKAGQTFVAPLGPSDFGGLVDAGDVLLSAMLMAPGVHYKEHHHAAPELYVILAGDSMWRRGGEPWKRHGAGALIHHASRQVHTTQSGAEPMLSLAIWYRDTASHATVV